MRWPWQASRPFDSLGDWQLAELRTALREPEGHTRALVTAARSPQTLAYVEAVSTMERWSPRTWLRLDAARLDAWNWYREAEAQPPNWSAVIDEPHSSTLLLVLAATHGDGFLRERA